MNVFVVEHVHVQDDGEESAKLIGIYSSKEAAQAAVNRLKSKPGFRDAPDGFSIDPYTLDEDNWTEGYFTYHYRDKSANDVQEPATDGGQTPPHP